jgi:VIT1/CCC1 family predicted Fe2+/Mn2+ transporter
MLISGPRNFAGLGNEQGTTSGSLMKGQGGDHMTSSAIFEDGYKATFYGNSLMVSSSGLVGIGVTNPTGSLDVSGSVYIRSSSGGVLYIPRLADPSHGLSIGEQNAIGSKAAVIRTGGGVSEYLFIDPGVNDSNIAANIALAYSNTGSVGIGTYLPSTKLQVVGLTGGASGGATSIPSLGFANSSSIALFTNKDTAYGTLFGTLNTGNGWIQQQRVDGTGTAYNLFLQPSGGNVSITTTQVLAKLNVKNSSYGAITRGLGLYNNTPGANYAGTGISLDFYVNAGDEDRCARIISTQATAGLFADLKFFTCDDGAPAARMTITSGGYVGIGVTNPITKLSVAGSIAMGLGGYLSGKTEQDHYNNELKREYEEVEHLRHREIEETKTFFANIGLSEDLQNKATDEIAQDTHRWVDFMMKYELGLEKPDPKRATKSAVNIGLSYIVGGIIPLSPYFFVSNATEALKISVVATLICLFVFGYFKSKITGVPAIWGAVRVTLIGALAAGAAFGVAKLFE